VPTKQTQRYFEWLCDSSEGGRLVKNGLRRYFHPKRIEYFATSAIGFHLDRTGVFNYNDYVNVALDRDNKPRIRSGPRPMNVLEPLLSLEHRIREHRPKLFGR
jgi:hypothetical protein